MKLIKKDINNEIELGKEYVVIDFDYHGKKTFDFLKMFKNDDNQYLYLKTNDYEHVKNTKEFDKNKIYQFRICSSKKLLLPKYSELYLIEDDNFYDIEVPNNLKELIDEEYNSLLHRYRVTRYKLLKDYAGKHIDNNTFNELIEDFGIKYNLLKKSCIVLDSVYTEDIKELKDFLNDFDNNLKQYLEYHKDSFYICDSENIQYNYYNDGEECVFECIELCADIVKINEVDKHYVKRLATLNIFEKHISPIFIFDYNALNNYLEGDLTTKGFLKQINPFINHTC